MRLGCWTPLLSKDDGIDDPAAAAVAAIRKAEDQGFDMVLVAERWLGPWLEAWMLAAALAVSTKRIELITAVHTSILNPQVVAKLGASLQSMSRGRAAINVVNGWWREEIDVYANGGWLDASDKRYQRMEEFINVVKGLWAPTPFGLQGEFFRIESGGLPIMTPSSPPRIYAVSRSDTGKAVIARTCDAWFIDAPPGYRKYEENFQAIAADVAEMSKRAKDLGRAVECHLNATILCADRYEEALTRADRLEGEARNNRKLLVAAGVRGLGAGLLGPPSLIAERMQRYREAGIRGFMLRFLPQPMGAEIFARDVLPLLSRREAIAA
jgi:dimethylsulfone monooxygenase